MKIGLGRVGRSPRRVKTRLRSAFHTIEIGAPNCDWVEIRSQRLERNGQFGKPSVLPLIEKCRVLESALEVARRSWRNVQVDPKPIRSDFELFVIMRLQWVGLNECLGDIALPQVIQSTVWIAIVEHVELPIPALHPQIEIMLELRDANRCMPLRIGFA